MTATLTYAPSPQPTDEAQSHATLAPANDNCHLHLVVDTGTAASSRRASLARRSANLPFLMFRGDQFLDLTRVKSTGPTTAPVDTPTWLHMDHLGSAQTGTSLNGLVAWREQPKTTSSLLLRAQYTPYGVTPTNPLSNKDQAGFTGHIKDSATGLNYMQARYYDPVIGRFLSIDPVGFSVGKPQMFNRFAYTFNDPVNNLDPDGKACVPCVPLAIWGARAAYAGYRAHKAAQVVGIAATAVAGHEAIQAVTNDEAGGEVRGENVRPTDEPVDLEEQLAGEEILGELTDGGGDDISDKMGDKERYGSEGTHDKVRGSHDHQDGTKTEVHADRDRVTKELSDTKFKDPPDNNKSRGPE